MSGSSKFLLDENIPQSVRRFLERRGLKVAYVPKGITNHEVALLAVRSGATLVTRDSDFSNTLLYPPSQFHGIVVLKIHPPKPEKLIRGLERLITQFERLNHRLFIIEEDTITVVEG